MYITVNTQNYFNYKDFLCAPQAVTGRVREYVRYVGGVASSFVKRSSMGQH